MITVINCYILLIERWEVFQIMKIIVNTSLMVPIYEQLVDQIKLLIRRGELKENDHLPSVRALSRDLKISALIFLEDVRFLRYAAVGLGLGNAFRRTITNEISMMIEVMTQVVGKTRYILFSVLK